MFNPSLFFYHTCQTNLQLRLLGLFKNYLVYKTITSRNVPSEAQIKIFFISWKYYVPFSRYSSFFKNPMIYQICNVTMSISTWDKVHFLIYLLKHNSWSHQTWSVDRYKKCNNCQYSFEQFGGQGLDSRSF